MSVPRNKKMSTAPQIMNLQASQSGSRKFAGALVSSLVKSKQMARGLASSRSHLLSSASKKSVVGIMPEKSGYSKGIQIYDDGGNDVTPLPLLDPNMARKIQTSLLGESSITPTDVLASQGTMMSGMATSAFGGGPFMRSVFSHSTDPTGESGPEDDITSDMLSTWADIQHKREEVKVVFTEAELEEMVDLVLEETETTWLLDLPSVCVAADSEEAPIIQQKNEKYQELCRSRVGNDLYAERGMNTFNDPPKQKAIQTDKISYMDSGFTCTNWDMYDTYAVTVKAAEEEKKDEEETISRPNSPKDEEPDGNGKTIPASQDTDGNFEGRAKPASQTETSRTDSSLTSSELFATKDSGTSSVPSVLITQEEEKIMKSESLRKDLFIMERVVNLNTYQPKLALYRGLQIVHDTDWELNTVNQIAVQDIGPNLDRLWSYTCSLTKGRNVSCLAWNKSNPDLIAVGYGQFEFTNQKTGLICCWSFKNPEYPERVYTSKQGVTALDFSVSNANLLAAGFYDGGVAIYNVRSTVDEPVLDNQESTGKQMGPIWQIQWIEKERGNGEERAEVLIAISADGRVTQWSIRKGFECYDIMKLKKLPTRMAGKAREKKGEAFISRHAGGLCFDFHPWDSNVYLAGTEDGYIHKCSCSYNEQYLETFSGHMAPVYRIRWSPFVPDIFLSCSADWSIQLWHQDLTTPVLGFHSSTKAVHDVFWSPRSSTVFASVNEGAVEVWDLAQSTLDPVITNTPTSGAKLTSVTFGRNTECILVGDSEGQVTVYELRCMPRPPEEQSAKLNNVIQASLASQLPHLSGEEDATPDLDDDADS